MVTLLSRLEVASLLGLWPDLAVGSVRKLSTLALAGKCLGWLPPSVGNNRPSFDAGPDGSPTLALGGRTLAAIS